MRHPARDPINFICTPVLKFRFFTNTCQQMLETVSVLKNQCNSTNGYVILEKTSSIPKGVFLLPISGSKPIVPDGTRELVN